MDEARARFLQDRVLTASPAQRIVMLYDRMILDLTRAQTADRFAIRQHTSHASQIVAELFGSLDRSADGPVENLAALYGYLLKELVNPDVDVLRARLVSLLDIVTTLRDAWATAAMAAMAATAATAAEPTETALVGNWVG